MATLTDQQLIQQIQQGRREASGLLFDRYSGEVYDFLARVVGDRDEAARLLGEVYQRVPTAVAAFPPHESVRGTLYSLGREAALNALRQKGWLDALPPIEESSASALANDIWKAARAMPGFHRAVLVVEELHSLSPTEKARALGVPRTDLPRVLAEARQSFNRQFDAQARAQGRLTTAQIDTERVIGLTRRVPNPDGTLFGFLPFLILPDSLQAKLRSEVVSPLGGEVRPHPTIPTQLKPEPAVESEPPIMPPSTVVVELPPTPAETQTTTPPQQPQVTHSTSTYQRRVVRTAPSLNLSSGWIIVLFLLLILLIIAGLVYYFGRDSTAPVLDNLNPPDGGTFPLAPLITITASFHDERGIDPTRVKLAVDGADVTSLALVTENAASYSGAFTLGPHVAEVKVFDRSGNETDQKWSFTVVAAPPSTATTTSTPTVTAIIPTITPVPFVPSATRTTAPVGPPLPPTPCLIGVAGTVFNDLNSDLFREANEPALANVQVILQDNFGRVIASANSDGLGRYSFSNLPNGVFSVSVVPPLNYTPTTPTIYTTLLLGCGAYTVVDFGFIFGTPTATNTLPPTQTPIFVTATPTFTPSPSATPAASLHGTVTNSKYAFPLPNVNVGITGPMNSATVSSASGQYNFASVLPGVYNVVGSRTGYQNGGGSLTIPPSTNATFNFVLVPCVSIVPGSTTVAPNPQVAGADITLGYTLNNACTTPVQLYLGSRIRKNGTSTVYVDPTHDTQVSVPASVSSAQVRLFTIPASAAPGSYDVDWTIWEGKTGSSLTGKYDGTDFVLNQLTVLAPSPTPTRTPTNTPTSTPTSTSTPTPTSTPP